MKDSQLEWCKEKLRHIFYTGANEVAVSQNIMAFKIKIHAGILQTNNRYNDLCIIVYGN